MHYSFELIKLVLFFMKLFLKGKAIYKEVFYTGLFPACAILFMLIHYFSSTSSGTSVVTVVGIK